MPIKLQKYIIIGIALIAVFFSGYFYRGEAEAEKTTIAISESVEKEVEIQDELIDLGLKHADKEIEVKVKEVIIKEEVIKYVKVFNDTDTCYDGRGVFLINQALGYTKGEDNKEHVEGQLSTSQ